MMQMLVVMVENGFCCRNTVIRATLSDEVKESLKDVELTYKRQID